MFDIFEKLHFIPDLHIVGGFVRDSLLGREPSDMDLASPLPPHEFIRACEAHGIQTKLINEQHGMVMCKVDDEWYEHTTFRKDVSTDGRHATIEYADTIQEDLARRDFTINAMAFSRKGLIDPHGGSYDLKNELLIAVGNAEERIKEDYLRIIRAARFAARLNFAISPIFLWESQTRRVEAVKKITAERIVMEFEKAFKDPKPSMFIKWLDGIGIFEELFPEFIGAKTTNQNPQYHPEGSVWNHTLEVIDRAPAHLRWHALLHDIGKIKTAEPILGTDFSRFPAHDVVGAVIVEQICKRLKMSNAFTKELVTVTRYHNRPMDIDASGSRYKSRKFQFEVGEYLPILKEFMHADAGDRPPRGFAFEDHGPTDYIVTGNDIIARGVLASNEHPTRIKDLKEFIHQEQLARGEFDRDRLLQTLEKRIKKLGYNSSNKN